MSKNGLIEILGRYVGSCSNDFDQSGDEWDAMRLTEATQAKRAAALLIELAHEVNDNLIVTGSSLGAKARAALSAAKE